MNHTTNYNLNQWEDGDVVRREDFNADNAAIDAALKTVADAAAGGVRILFGTYIGNNTSSRLINLGVEPKAVLVLSNSSSFSDGSKRYGGLAMTDCPATYNTHTVLSVASEGFMVYYDSNHGVCSNIEYTGFRYIAFY